MKKVPFVTKEQLDEIVKKYPTPFHLYDEKGIRENVKALKEAFSWNPGFKEYFAVKATPNPSILQIMKEEGCGLDCATKVELMMAKACGFTGHDVMFSSNVTPADEYAYAKDMGVIINFDDITHLKKMWANFLRQYAVVSIQAVISRSVQPSWMYREKQNTVLPVNS